jgi:L-aspartate oxidase
MLECLVYGERAAVASLDDGKHTTTGEPQYVSTSHRPPPNAHQSSRLNQRNPSSSSSSSSIAHRLASGEDLAQRLDRDLGVERDGDTLRALIAALPDPTKHSDHNIEPDQLIPALAARSALLREESRGAHYRTDFPQTQTEWQGRILWQRGSPPRFEPVAQKVATINQQPAAGNPYALQTGVLN